MSAGSVIGQAVIEIGADGSHFAADAAAKTQGPAKKAGGRIAGALGGALKIGAIGAGAAVAGVLGTALGKGFERLKTIDQAKAKLTGLGHSSTAVTKIMDNALNAVKGTAFGMGEAAGQAATLVAAGIKPGKDLENTLRLVGDSATIAGSSLDEMGAIFGKVAANGKVSGEVIAQLQDRGVPALKFLADEMGTTQAAVSDMVSSGEIDFETFQRAMDKGLGGAALSAGQTFAGGLANMQAALGRLGAKLLGGVFSKLPDLFTDATKGLDALGPVALKVGEFIGTAFGKAYTAVHDFVSDPVVRAYFTWFVATVQWVAAVINEKLVVAFYAVKDAVTGSLGGLSGILAPIGAAFTGLRDSASAALGGAGGISGLIDTVFGAIGPLLHSYVDTYGPILLAAFSGIASVISTALGVLGPIITSVFAQMGPIIQQYLSIIGPLIIGVLGTVVNVVTSIMTTLGPIIATVFGALIEVLPPILAAIATVIPVLLAGLSSFAGFLTSVFALIGPIISTAVAVVLPVIASLVTFVLGQVVPAFFQLVGFLQTFLMPIFAAVAGVIVRLLPILGMVAAFIVGQVLPAVMGIVRAVASRLVPIFTAVQEVITGTIVPALDIFIAKFMEMWPTIQKVIMVIVKIIGFILKLAATILGAVIPVLIKFAVFLVGTVIKAIIKVISGIANFIVAVIKIGAALVNSVRDAAKWVAGIVKAIVGVVKKAGEIPGKVKSALGNLGSLLLGAGGDLVRGLISGIGGAAGALYEKARSLASGALSAIKGALGIGSPSKKTKKQGEFLVRGLALGIIGTKEHAYEALDKIMNKLKDVGEKGAAAVVKTFKSALGAKGLQLERLDASIDVATAALKEKLDVYTSTLTSMRDTLSDSGAFGGEPKSFKSITKVLTGALTNTLRLRDALNTLKAQGLNNVSFEQLSSAGLSALLAAEALAKAGPAGVAQVNDLQSQLDKAALGAATTTADKLYKASVDSAKGFLDTLLKARPVLIKAFEDIAKAMVAALTRSINATKTGVKAKAAGGATNWSGGPILVGERGPEIVNLPKGSDIFTAAESRRLLSSLAPSRATAVTSDGAGSGTTVLQVDMTVSVDDLAKMSKIGDFLKMLEDQRVNARKTARSGKVSA